MEGAVWNFNHGLDIELILGQGVLICCCDLGFLEVFDLWFRAVAVQFGEVVQQEKFVRYEH